MATNKHATIRYQALDKCFRNPGRKYFIEDLINACNDALADYYFKGDGIKRRQIFDDINFMESERGYSAPIERYKDGKRVFYRYSDLKFSINSQPLNESEANQLKEALLTLSRFKGMPQFEWVQEMLVRIESSFKLNNRSTAIIGFEENPFLKGLEHFNALFNAIEYHKVLHIKYLSFKHDKPFKFILHPYYLKQYNNRWFLFGLNEGFKNLTNLALDRILEIKEGKENYIENTNVNFDEYFEDVVGVSLGPGQDVQTIKLKISKELWPYIESKPIHGSQKNKGSDGKFYYIELEVQINYELISLLFSYAEGITVIEPNILKSAIKNKADALLKNYL